MMNLLSPRDASRRLGISTSRLIQLDREGVFRALRDSAGRRFYDADAVERFAKQRLEQREQRARRPRRAASGGTYFTHDSTEDRLHTWVEGVVRHLADES